MKGWVRYHPELSGYHRDSYSVHRNMVDLLAVASATAAERIAVPAREVVVRTRRGRQRTRAAAKAALQRAHGWERLLLRHRFPPATERLLDLLPLRLGPRVRVVAGHAEAAARVCCGFSSAGLVQGKPWYLWKPPWVANQNVVKCGKCGIRKLSDGTYLQLFSLSHT